MEKAHGSSLNSDAVIEALIVWMEHPLEICGARRKHGSAKIKGKNIDLASSAIKMRAATFTEAAAAAAAP
jgi:hypothetical protein